MKNIFKYVLSIIVTLIVCAWWMSCTDSSSSDTKYPIKELILLKETELPFKEPSGIAFSESFQKMWIVSGDQSIYRLDTNGTKEKKLNYAGTDLEGITFDIADSTLWVIDEDTKILSHLSLEGDILFQTTISYTSELNNGPEGITIGKNHPFYAVNEKHPSNLFELNSQFTISRIFELNFAKDYSDISYDNSTNTFLILSDESKAFYRVNENIDVIAQYPLPSFKNEGIAYDIKRNQYYVVNDGANTLSVYKEK